MVKSIGELSSNPNFVLKFIILVIGILVNVLLYYPVKSDSADTVMINGYHYSFLTVIGTLLIAYIFFEATPVMEICLLAVALVKLILIAAHGENVAWDKTKLEDYFNEEKHDKYYGFMLANIGSIVLLVIDILLKVGKK